MIGYVILISGLAWGAHRIGLPGVWIGIGSIILLGLGVITGVSQTRYREPSPEDKGTRRVIVDDEG